MKELLNRKEIKNYSKEILKVCKLHGYFVADESFENFFEDYSCFYFIPSFKEAIERIDEEDYEKFEEYIKALGEIVDEIVDDYFETDSEIKLSFAEVEAFANENYDSIGEFITEQVSLLCCRAVIDWFLEKSNQETKEEFLNWILE